MTHAYISRKSVEGIVYVVLCIDDNLMVGAMAAIDKSPILGLLSTFKITHFPSSSFQ